MNSVTCMAPTKTFNIAGLNTAAVMIPNPVLRHKVWRALNTDEVAEPNAFAMTATLAAFNESEPWLEELRAYLAGNKAEARAMINEYNAAAAPERRIALIESHATILVVGRLFETDARYRSVVRTSQAQSSGDVLRRCRVWRQRA